MTKKWHVSLILLVVKQFSNWREKSKDLGKKSTEYGVAEICPFCLYILSGVLVHATCVYLDVCVDEPVDVQRIHAPVYYI